MVSYKVKPERVAEHEGLVRAVFDALAASKPAGLRYGAFKRPDGVSFVHVAFVEAEKNPLDSLAEFKAFTAQIKDRIEEPPVTVELSAVATYGF
jgi:hypothetical protein